MNKKIHIIGAGGHTRSLQNLIRHCGYQISGIYDDSFDVSNSEHICEILLQGELSSILDQDILTLAIGDNKIRASLFNKYKAQLLLENLIHPTAVIENYVQMRKANQILGGVTINSGASLGDNNIINTKALIEHETTIGSHNHVAVGAILAGRVKVGNCCMIGAGAVVIDKVSICDEVIIGAGSVVLNTITQPGVYVGNPARQIK